MGEQLKPLAGISMDLDNLWSYMKTHGDSGWERFPSYLDTLIPPVIDILGTQELSITFFVVGQDAVRKENRSSLRAITESGHEVGNHSFSHEPWIHLLSREEIHREVAEADEAIRNVTDQKPVGFRGPGFSWSASLLEVLIELGYAFDASSLPTFIGPLARMYYFWSSGLSKEERRQRSALFGTFSQGFRSNRPHALRTMDGRRLLELPVTTFPVIRTPFHFSYLLYLARISEKLLDIYLGSALRSCRFLHVPVSFLLHPLDFLSGEEVPELRFFPAMDLEVSRKRALVGSALRMLREHFRLVPMSVLASEVAANQKLRTIALKA